MSADWAYRQAITLSAAQVDGEHRDFPVLVSASVDAWRNEQQGGHVAQRDGRDIVFTAGDGTTRLDHELEAYDPDQGSLTAWVRVPALSDREDTVLYVYYGNPTADDLANPSGVWAGEGQGRFQSVWHLNEMGNAPRWDSTGNLNVCVPFGFEGSQFIEGVVGGGDLLDGRDDGLRCADRPGLDGADAMTMSAWVKLTQRPEEDEWSNILWKKKSYGLYLYGEDDDHTTLGFQLRLDGKEHDEYDLGRVDIRPGRWHHLAVTYDGARVRAYVDGQLDYSHSASGTIEDSEYALSMGEAESKKGISLGAALDEVRVVAAARSAAWIATSYRNQAAPAAFLSVGPLESP